MQQDAGKAFRQIERQVKRHMTQAGVGFRTVRVYLGDTSQPYVSGGGHAVPVRHWLAFAAYFDIVVDSTYVGAAVPRDVPSSLPPPGPGPQH